jgi:hypothetical protein
MKWIGTITAILGAWLLKSAWYDPVEGKFFRPVAVLLIAGGLLAFFEGLKREIIAGVRQGDKKDKGS